MAEPFEILPALSPTEGMVGAMEHVVRLVVGRMALQQVQVLIDGLGQTDLADQPLDRPQAAIGEAPAPLGSILLDVAAAKHRLRWVLPGTGAQSSFDSFLASA